MKQSYETIRTESSARLVEKKSVFIAHSFIVSSESQAIAHITEIKKKFHDATHNVYAYYIEGENSQAQQKFSDAGEPSGTAGLPVLEVLRKSHLENVLIIVTRYFGGTQLGAPGLVRAYGKVASMCIAASEIITKDICTLVEVEIPYSQLEKIQKFASEHKLEISQSTFGEKVALALLVPNSQLENWELFIQNSLR
ncbi:MAG: YigZ family protein [Bacillota bacterium]